MADAWHFSGFYIVLDVFQTVDTVVEEAKRLFIANSDCSLNIKVLFTHFALFFWNQLIQLCIVILKVNK